MKSYSREQLSVILLILLIAGPLSLATVYSTAAAKNVLSAPAPAAVYEVRGDGMREGYYCFNQEQTLQELITAAGGLKQKNSAAADAFSTIRSGKKIIIDQRPDQSVRWEVRELDAAARINFFMPVQINTARAEDLTLIPGIGPRTA
jgi:DNA uptake protein ComE-like DNA-binding protein